MVSSIWRQRGQIQRKAKRSVASVAILVLWTASPELRTQRQFTLTVVEVAGSDQLTSEDVVSLSGLVVGQSLAVDELDQAAQRLAQSGSFASVQYSYVTTGSDIRVTLQVEEQVSTIPVIFDNFVGFEDRLLADAVRAIMPAFDGYAPDTAVATDAIARALQGVLNTRSFSGAVEFRLSSNMVTGERAHLFRIAESDVALDLCEIRFEGVEGVSANELTTAVPDLVGTSYSRTRLASLAEGTWRRVHRQHGYWAASFGEPTATLEGDRCSGVSVTTPVAEGAQYTWAGTAWTGGTVFGPEELDSLMGLPRGQIARLSDAESGPREVKRAYGRRGYLLMEISYVPRLDAQARDAVLDMTLEEGPQYRMGTLSIEGVSASEMETLRRSWALARGEPYDDSYLASFNEALNRTQWGRLAGDQMRELLDPQRLVVDVTLRFDDVR